MSPELLTHQFFSPLIGATFTILLPATDPPTRLSLASVTPLLPPQRRNDVGEAAPVTDGPARQEPFSLHFRGPLDHPLGQATYRMMPAPASVSAFAPAALDIFIVPIGRDAEGFIYEAIFG